MGASIIFLSSKELEKMYPDKKQSKAAKLTREFVEKGYKITRVNSPSLASIPKEELFESVNKVLNSSRKNGSKLEIVDFSDLSKLSKGTVFVAYKLSRRVNKSED